MNPSAKGARSEMLACADLTAKGYEVFRAISPGASCDLLAMKDGLILRVEVKSAIWDHGKVRFTATPVARYDMLAVVVDTIVYYPNHEPGVSFYGGAGFLVFAEDYQQL